MKLLIADDHTLFRDALVQYIERAEPEAELVLAKDFNEVLPLMEEDPYKDLVLLDLRMPGMNGMEGFEKMRTYYPDVPVALMSGVAKEQDVRKAMEMGASGYFPKTLSGKALLTAIQHVLAGEKFMPIERETNRIMPSFYDDSSQAKENIPAEIDKGDIKLTPREVDVLQYLVDGSSNKEIANALNLQVVTIKLHVRGIFRKLGVKNRTQAALKARELKILS